PAYDRSAQGRCATSRGRPTAPPRPYRRGAALRPARPRPPLGRLRTRARYTVPVAVGGSSARWPNGQRRGRGARRAAVRRSEEHTSELQSRENLVCRLLLEKKKN